MKKRNKIKTIKDIILIILILIFILSPDIRTNICNFVFDKMANASEKVGKNVGNIIVINNLDGQAKYKISEIQDIIDTAYKNNITVRLKTLKDKEFKEFSSKNKLDIKALNKNSKFIAKSRKNSENKLISVDLTENK
ncbi:hypothetical protein HAHI6034_05860 [Hathewaya histolytica]|uniref:Uncharacterized protein n=1 Tax=Hathewaya histolytica TaxID=1498 RepID=A0A4U9RLD4_HATHI|nr:hypothetical protein [Hathewaya histolytica]VTQ89640.1 Uncharacterised protein [Hathewaya histolytica]